MINKSRIKHIFHRPKSTPYTPFSLHKHHFNRTDLLHTIQCICQIYRTPRYCHPIDFCSVRINYRMKCIEQNCLQMRLCEIKAFIIAVDAIGSNMCPVFFLLFAVNNVVVVEKFFWSLSTLIQFLIDDWCFLRAVRAIFLQHMYVANRRNVKIGLQPFSLP